MRFIGLLLLASATLLAQDSGISAERIREHTRFLASDLLEGRGPGQRAASSPPSTSPRSWRSPGQNPPARMARIFRRCLWWASRPSRAQLSAAGGARDVI